MLQRNKTPGFTDAERESFTNVLHNGFVDIFRQQNPDEQQFTYWSYRFNAKAKNKGIKKHERCNFIYTLYSLENVRLAFRLFRNI